VDDFASADDRGGAARASLATFCLGFLFTPPPLPATTPRPVEDAQAGVSTDAAVLPSFSVSGDAGSRPSKRARKERRPNPDKLAADATTLASATAPGKLQQQQQQQRRIEASEEEGVPKCSAGGAGMSATYSARLAAAEALAKLARSSAAGVHDSSGANTTAPCVVKSGTRKRRDGSSSSTCSSRQTPPVTAGGRGSASGGETVIAETARDLVMSAVTERAGSGWAWERELAFLLMACCVESGGGEGQGEW